MVVVGGGGGRWWWQRARIWSWRTGAASGFVAGHSHVTWRRRAVSGPAGRREEPRVALGVGDRIGDVRVYLRGTRRYGCMDTHRERGKAC